MDSWPTTDHVGLTEEIARRLRSVSEDAAIPLAKEVGVSQRKDVARERLITLAAWWGRLTHQLPVRIARSIAVKQSSDADDSIRNRVRASHLRHSPRDCWHARPFLLDWLPLSRRVIERSILGGVRATSSPLLAQGSFVSSQFFPTPRSTTRGTDSSAACSISYFTSS